MSWATLGRTWGDTMKNIVLIGMMGSGKTTCGKLLAEKLGRPFVDCDEVIEGFAKHSIPDIFEHDGEDVFRDLESMVIKELSAQEGLVIATGGGAVLRQANVTALRSNGILLFLNRPVGEIFDSVAMDGRPLAQSGKEAFEATFRLRLPTYRTAADAMIFDFSTPEATVAEMLEKLKSVGKKFLVINGPNLNLLGKREPGVYGDQTYDALCRMICDYAKAHNAEADCFQSNHEGAIIDKIHEADGMYDGIIINPAAYTHYSYAILDALKAVSVPAYEVHISNISEREPFRAISVTAPACVGQIYGLGFEGYLRAMDWFLEGGQ